MNFLLYCCFSDRFRSTFSSSFVFLSKYCAHYIGPNWKITKDDNTNSLSVENMSFYSPYNQSNSSLRGPSLNTRISNMSADISQKSVRKTLSYPSQRQSQISYQKRQSWTTILSNFKSNKNNKTEFKQSIVWKSSETVWIIRLQKKTKGLLDFSEYKF